MPVDTLFITDLHGNIEALVRAVELARDQHSIKYLVIGGDIAPNLITVKLTDGEFVLRHAEVYHPSIANSFRQRLIVNRIYRSDEEHGKASVSVSFNLSRDDFLGLDQDGASALLAYPSSFQYLIDQQLRFAESQLLPLLANLLRTGIQSYVMLGNDDFVELEPLFIDADREGGLTYLGNRVAHLGESYIVGYSHVLSKPFRYRYWEKTESQIASDLKSLLRGLDPRRVVLSIHMPPYGTHLDRIGTNGEHIGSLAVREILETDQYAIGLFGHVHESYLVSGQRHDHVGSNIVINPGAYHNKDNCSLVFDSSNPKQWFGLWDLPH